jgi:hypothetical protein
MTSRSLWYNIPHSIEWFHLFFQITLFMDVATFYQILHKGISYLIFLSNIILSSFHFYWCPMIYNPIQNQACPYNKLFSGLCKFRTVLKYNIHNGWSAGGTTRVITHVVEQYEQLHQLRPSSARSHPQALLLTGPRTERASPSTPPRVVSPSSPSSSASSSSIANLLMPWFDSGQVQESGHGEDGAWCCWRCRPGAGNGRRTRLGRKEASWPRRVGRAVPSRAPDNALQKVPFPLQV